MCGIVYANCRAALRQQSCRCSANASSSACHECYLVAPRSHSSSVSTFVSPAHSSQVDPIRSAGRNFIKPSDAGQTTGAKCYALKGTGLNEFPYVIPLTGCSPFRKQTLFRLAIIRTPFRPRGSNFGTKDRVRTLALPVAAFRSMGSAAPISSEHCHANALDVRSLKMDNGTVIELTNAMVQTGAAICHQCRRFESREILGTERLQALPR
jgi:hypothetical protein